MWKSLLIATACVTSAEAVLGYAQNNFSAPAGLWSHLILTLATSGTGFGSRPKQLALCLAPFAAFLATRRTLAAAFARLLLDGLLVG